MLAATASAKQNLRRKSSTYGALDDDRRRRAAGAAARSHPLARATPYRLRLLRGLARMRRGVGRHTSAAGSRALTRPFGFGGGELALKSIVSFETSIELGAERAAGRGVARIVQAGDLTLEANLVSRAHEILTIVGEDRREHARHQIALQRVTTGIGRMRWHTNRGFESRLELVRPWALETTLGVEDRDRRVALDVLEERPRFGGVGELAVHFRQ